MKGEFLGVDMAPSGVQAEVRGSAHRLSHFFPHRYLSAVGLALYRLQPISVPGFAFSWLEVVAHRTLLPRMLAPGNGQGSALYEVGGDGSVRLEHSVGRDVRLGI